MKNKKNQKKSSRHTINNTVVKKAIAIFLSVVIILGAVAGILNFFGVFQQLTVSVKGTEYKFSLAEYNFYYYNMAMNYTQQSNKYDANYGKDSGITYIGYDYRKTPDAQEYTDAMSSIAGYTLEALGNPKNPTWEDVFKKASIEQLIQIKFGAEKAKEANLTLNDSEINKITNSIDDERRTATANDYSLNRWLRMQYGNGVNEKLLRKIYEEQTLATKYYETLQKGTLDTITEEQVVSRYNERKDDYDITSLRIFGIDPINDDGTGIEEEYRKKAESRINAMFSEITDEKSFIKQVELDVKLNIEESENFNSNLVTAAQNVTYKELAEVDEKLAKWAYDDERQVGDKEIIVTDNSVYYIVLMTELPHKDISISSGDVRHILIQFPEKNTDGTETTKKDDDGNTVLNVTAKTKEETRAKAQKILDEYTKNPTEENFIALVKEHTDDINSAETGGLYENVSSSSSFVTSFKNWAINSARKTGDTGIIETEYGYHIMYYVESNGNAWYEQVKQDIFYEDYTKQTDDLLEDYYTRINTNSILINWTTNKQNELIGKQITSSF